MAKIFREEAPASESLRGYFLAWKEINPEKLAILSRQVHGAGHERGRGSGGHHGGAFRAVPRPHAAGRSALPERPIVSFLEELTFRFPTTLRAGRRDAGDPGRVDTAVREALMRLDIYNMSPQTGVEVPRLPHAGCMRERRQGDGGA